MSGMLFALALFGCTDDGSACQRLGSTEQTYESRVECLAAQRTALDSEAAMEADYPSILAQCMTRSQLARIGHGPVNIRKAGFTMADAAE
ncbi:hypothetical protein [uncultured Novosphingobium sp.]|uniref:hypothetical protein n=1 Tax=Novosphingobium fluoreni TaxID=1391222 RepID=UPI000735FEF7|nr:hypothetical protein [uncultured Novosphingobium sp.]KTR84284.1 hypothetical protein NS277_05615 [Novosphingobium barchaimii]